MSQNPFDMLGGLGGLGGMLAGFQQQMQQIQEQAQLAEFDGQAGGGLVKATCNGKNEVLALDISDEAYEDRELLEDLIIAAVNDGMRKAESNTREKMAALTAGLPIPPGLLGL
jgi:DNA-binding YbaB/EbfC family protein